ncbi:MAG: hypothetical protein LBQ57_00220 [Spirochaetales bacterium]|jgi:23S rRNA G2445 N2-methylase RlmL|nr:hypothetical protein [Spirochaetales bacterium]
MKDSPDSFMKRVRRQVVCRDYTFLAVVQPALRGVCGSELAENGFTVNGETEAGLEFSGSLREGWRANLVLRTASRVYCRVARFRAGAREELYRRVAAFAWELWLPPAAEVRIRVKVRRSRLRHEGAAAQAFFDGLRRHYGNIGLPAPREALQENRKTENCQRVLLRVTRNSCEISLDMSGMPLYTRGYRTGGGIAPLRESLAAALLRELGWTGEGILADGMTGSGTLAIEAALISGALPPGGNRVFRFQAWPSFTEPAWRHIQKKAAPAACPANGCLFALDISAQAIGLAQKNAGRAGVQDRILWERGDFFNWTGTNLRARSRAAEQAPGYLVLNPPYGKRLAEGGEHLYRNLGRHILRNFSGWNALVLFPGAALLKAFGGEPKRILPLRHGGINILAGFF